MVMKFAGEPDCGFDADAGVLCRGAAIQESEIIVSPKMGADGIKDQDKPTRADFSLK
jgi:hypothetical protein